MSKKQEFFVTDDNIFADLGLENADELLARSELISEISHLIKTSHLSQKEIAELLGISQPKISMLVSGKLSAFSADTLMRYLNLLGYSIEIKLKKGGRLSRKMSRGRLSVARNKRNRIKRTRKVLQHRS